MIKTKRQIVVENNKLQYNRQSYHIGTRVSHAQIAHRLGYLDKKTNIMFHDQWLDYDAWIWLVNKVREKLDLSPQNAARYVNSIYQTKLKGKDGSRFGYLAQYVLLLRDTCGKWFSVVPSMMVV